jgi:hypothetical protein
VDKETNSNMAVVPSRLFMGKFQDHSAPRQAAGRTFQAGLLRRQAFFSNSIAPPFPLSSFALKSFPQKNRAGGLQLFFENDNVNHPSRKGVDLCKLTSLGILKFLPQIMSSGI